MIQFGQQLLNILCQSMFGPTLQLARNPLDLAPFAALETIFEIGNSTALWNLCDVSQLDLEVPERTHAFQNFLESAPQFVDTILTGQRLGQLQHCDQTPGFYA